jgi:hypothetical protein
VEPPPIQVPDEDAPGEGLAPADAEAEIRRAAFRWVQDEKSEAPTDDSPEPDSEAEKQRQELESILGESITAAPDAPGVGSDTPNAGTDDPPDDTASIADERREEFERFRLGMDAGAQETVAPYVAEDAKDEVEPPGGVWPAGPAEDPESEDWHNAFERLASEREGPDDFEAPEGTAEPEPSDPAGDTPSDEPGDTSPAPEEDNLDIGSWHDAFQKLTAERGTTDGEPDAPPQEEPPAEEATPFESETLGEGVGSETGATEEDDDATSTFTVDEETSEEGAARLEEFARLQQQASEPDDSPPSSESALRMAEFDRLRQEALEGGPPAEQAPPEPTSMPDDDAMLSGDELPDEGAAVAEATLEGADLDAPQDIAPPVEPEEVDGERRTEVFRPGRTGIVGILGHEGQRASIPHID